MQCYWRDMRQCGGFGLTRFDPVTVGSPCQKYVKAIPSLRKTHCAVRFCLLVLVLGVFRLGWQLARVSSLYYMPSGAVRTRVRAPQRAAMRHTSGGFTFRLPAGGTDKQLISLFALQRLWGSCACVAASLVVSSRPARVGTGLLCSPWSWRLPHLP